MNIENLSVGQVFKNYKDLCNTLGEKVKTGNAKIYQLKELERYIKYHKEGYKFIIDEIYSLPKPKEDGRSNNKGGNNSIFKDDFRYLMLYMLHNDRSESMVMSKTALYKALNLINENYQLGRGNISRLAEIIEVPETAILDFYENNSRKLRDTVERNLKSCRREGMFIYESVECVAINEVHLKYNQFGQPILDDKGGLIYRTELEYREATKSEKQLIIKFEKQTLKEMGLLQEKQKGGFLWYDETEDSNENSKNSVFLSKNQRMRFNKIMQSKLKKAGTNIKFYYRGYKLTWNNEDIDEEYRNMCEYMDMKLKSEYNDSEEEKENLSKVKSNINGNFVKSVNKSTQKRHDVALEEIKYAATPILIDKYSEQSKDTYVEEQNKITSTLINEKAKSLKYKI